MLALLIYAVLCTVNLATTSSQTAVLEALPIWGISPCWGAEGSFILSSTPLLSSILSARFREFSLNLQVVLQGRLSWEACHPNRSHLVTLLVPYSPCLKDLLKYQNFLWLNWNIIWQLCKQSTCFHSQGRERKASVKKHLFKWLCLWINDISQKRKRNI